MRCSQNANKQSSQTASFKGISSIRSRSRRPTGHPSHKAQGCDLRTGNRMTLSMGTPQSHIILTPRSLKFKLRFWATPGPRSDGGTAAATRLGRPSHGRPRPGQGAGRPSRGRLSRQDGPHYCPKGQVVHVLIGQFVGDGPQATRASPPSSCGV
jgi:hypothetical protein